MEVVDFVVDPLRSGIDRRALLELAMVGSVCGALGFWIVVERLSSRAGSPPPGPPPGPAPPSPGGAPLLPGGGGGAGGAPPLTPSAPRDAPTAPDRETAIAVTGL